MVDISDFRICVALHRAHAALGTLRVDARDAEVISEVRSDLEAISQLIASKIEAVGTPGESDARDD